MNTNRSNRRIFSFHGFIIVLYVLSTIIFLYLSWYGKDFYLTPINIRPHNPEYRMLRPAGKFGHTVGMIGSVMMLLMLLYSVRKRTRLLRNIFPLSNWLQLHIYFGIFGPLLIILHSSFKVQGLIAVSFWSMIAVALSGVLGRYLYLQIPRTLAGSEIDFRELEQMNQNLSQEIQHKYQIEPNHLESIEVSVFPRVRPEKGLMVALFSMIYNDSIRPIRTHRLKKHLVKKLNLSSQAIAQMLGIIKRKAMLQRRISMWNAIHQLFHYWHVIHKPFAIIMYIIMFIHILIAVYVGYTWIF
jgi:hypothetical protein